MVTLEQLLKLRELADAEKSEMNRAGWNKHDYDRGKPWANTLMPWDSAPAKALQAFEKEIGLTWDQAVDQKLVVSNSYPPKLCQYTNNYHYWLISPEFVGAETHA